MSGPGIAAAAALLAVALPCATVAQERTAEEQYRVARRLLAQESPDARAALQRVVQLDPDGPFVDDALVDEARLARIAEWPEELGRVELDAARRARALLDRGIAVDPQADRGDEARYLRALLALEPLAGYDTTAAVRDLAAAAASRAASEWPTRARYVLAWLGEREGQHERARATYTRLIVEGDGGPIEARARLGLARVLLRVGEPGEAAHWLQQEVQAGRGSASVLLARELAVRSLLAPDRAGAGRPTPTATDVRDCCGIAAPSGTGVVLADCRSDRVIEIGLSGSASVWVIPDLRTIAADGGRVLAVAGTSVVELRDGGATVPRGTLGDLSTAGAMAVDGEGAIFLVDRAGERLARLGPGDTVAVTVREDRERKIVGLAWDGSSLVGVDAREGVLVAFDRAGGWTARVEPKLARPVAIGADPAGRLAVLDAKAGVVALRARGVVLGSYAFAADGVERPVALAFGPDGVLHLFDAATATWWRRP